MRITLGKIVLLVLAAAVASVGFVKHERRIHEQNFLGRIASEIAGRKVGVRCPSFLGGLVDVRGEAGRVQFDAEGHPGDHTDLAPETCSALAKFKHVDFSCIGTGTCGYSQFQAAWAAHTLAHESFHLRGFEDEGVTECYALQTTSYVAERLGLSPERSDELQRWVFTKGYPNEPDEYRSSACYPGGPLDLHPTRQEWP